MSYIIQHGLLPLNVRDLLRVQVLRRDEISAAISKILQNRPKTLSDSDMVIFPTKEAAFQFVKLYVNTFAINVNFEQIRVIHDPKAVGLILNS